MKWGGGERTFYSNIGVGPGLAQYGWGVIDTEGNRLKFVASGCIKPPIDEELSKRLLCLHDEIKKLIEEYHPDEAAVEETFVNAGPRSALLLGQAPGRMPAGTCLLRFAGGRICGQCCEKICRWRWPCG